MTGGRGLFAARQPNDDAYAVDGAIEITCPACAQAPGRYCRNPITGNPRIIPCPARLTEAANVTRARRHRP